jgi:hypothetical protein
VEQPIAERALRALDPLVGDWTLTAVGPDGEPWPGEGRVSVEWHRSGAHLVQRTVVGGAAPDSTAIIGCDGANGTYTQLYSDERGVCRIYEMDISRNEWNLQRVGTPFPQRFLGTFSEDGRTISGCWQKAEDGGRYTVDFYLTYRKTSWP